MNQILVIHVNAFTLKIQGGYVGTLIEGKIVKMATGINAEGVIRYLVENPGMQVDFTKI